MPKQQSADSTRGPVKPKGIRKATSTKGARCCCKTRQDAATKGHYDCYKLIPPYKRQSSLFPLLRIALQNGHVAFARRICDEEQVDVRGLAFACTSCNDMAGLEGALRLDPRMDLIGLSHHAAIMHPENRKCLSYLLDHGAPWEPDSLITAARHNALGVLDVVLKHKLEWSPRVAGTAACAGNVLFLMRIFEAGCPVWTWSFDGEPARSRPGYYIPARRTHPCLLEDWGLVVSSDLLCSGPVLLLAAKKGTPLTPRMQGMLAEVRRRALALASCFRMAYLLSQRPGASASSWEAMGRVPVEIVQQIATLARVSIDAREVIT